MKKLIKILYNLFVGLFWLCTFGFGAWATVSIIYICFREFGKAKTSGIYCLLFFVGSIISILLGMGVDVLETKLKIRRW